MQEKIYLWFVNILKQLKCQIDIENSNSKKNKMPEFIELSDETKDKKITSSKKYQPSLLFIKVKTFV